MNDSCYVVTGCYTAGGVRVTMYAGTSMKRAFELVDSYDLKAEIIIQVWEDGFLVRELKQENIKNKL